MHFQVANKNKGFRKNNDEFWPWLAATLKKYEVQVLVGDFNVSLFKVVPELRSRGVPASLAAWYPWRTTSTNQPMADSCGIFVCVPAVVTPNLTTNMFDTPWFGLDEIEEHGGPGQSLHTYLPKSQEIIEKLKDTFDAAVAAEGPEKGKGKGKGKDKDDAAVAGKGKGKGKKQNQREGLTVREKRLNVVTWMHQGKNHKGSHFPLAAFTNNVGRRSEERYVARANRRTHWP